MRRLYRSAIKPHCIFRIEGAVSLHKNVVQALTIEGDDEPSLRGAVREIITKYRSPRTVYALWGSNPEGQAIAAEIIEEQDGWW